MSRSKQTFNKKEVEKKKLKRKKEKEQKREERKNAPSKETSFEDMLAYVDEFGNISSTPPDPNKKTEIKAEEIEIGVAKQEPLTAADLIRKGTVTFFNTNKGYGFIRDHQSQDSIFVHVNSLQEEVQELDVVNFETEKGPRGLNAINVKKIS